jgi:hypothetical protein
MGMQRAKGRYVVQLDPTGEVPHEGEEVKHLALKPSNLSPSSLLREGFRSAHWSTMRVLRPAPPPIDVALSDEQIAAMGGKELRAMVEPHTGAKVNHAYHIFYHALYGDFSVCHHPLCLVVVSVVAVCLSVFAAGTPGHRQAGAGPEARGAAGLGDLHGRAAQGGCGAGGVN